MTGKATLFTVTLFLFLLLQAPTASFAQQDETATRAAPYRIAIFPARGSFGTGTEYQEDQTAEILQARIRRDPALALTYSYYDSALNEPRIEDPKRLWVGIKKPNLEWIYRMARERKADGVVIAWFDLGNFFTLPVPDVVGTIRLYLIDVDRQQVYQRKGSLATVKEMGRSVFAAFLGERGKTPSPTIYRVGVFPFDSNKPVATGIEAVQEQTADMLHEVTDRNPLFVLAYSYYDRMLNEPSLRKRDKLWAGKVVRKKPEVSLVSAAARERNIDGVLMCWIKVRGNFSLTGDVQVEVYLIDVDSRKVYRAKGPNTKTTKLVDKVFSQFLDDQP